jgi:hypothetical protein
MQRQQILENDMDVIAEHVKPPKLPMPNTFRNGHNYEVRFCIGVNGKGIGLADACATLDITLNATYSRRNKGVKLSLGNEVSTCFSAPSTSTSTSAPAAPTWAHHSSSPGS